MRHVAVYALLFLTLCVNAWMQIQDIKGPRAINPFLMFCQVQKDVMKSKSKRSAADMRKAMGDMWRKCSDKVGGWFGRLSGDRFILLIRPLLMCLGKRPVRSTCRG